MHTIDSIIQKYREDVLPGLGARTQKDNNRHFDRLSVMYGKRAAETLTQEELTEWVGQAAEGKGREQRRKQLGCLRVAFQHAVSLRWLKYNVVKEVSVPRGKPRDRVVTEKEFQRLISMTKDMRVILGAELTLLTGLPQQDILDLTWSQVYPVEGVIRQHNKRTDRIDEIRITPELEEVLRQCKQLPINAKTRTYVLPPRRKGPRYTGEAFRACWQRNMRKYVKAGNKRFNFQDLTNAYRYRQERAAEAAHKAGAGAFVHEDRIKELRSLLGFQPDVRRLVRLCEEINTSLATKCFMAVALLTRTVINHVPPALGHKTFSEVANNYGGDPRTHKSFKQIAKKLEDAARIIGDMVAHQTMRPVESLPTPSQIDFSQEFDVLLAEVARVIREKSILIAGGKEPPT